MLAVILRPLLQLLAVVLSAGVRALAQLVTLPFRTLHIVWQGLLHKRMAPLWGCGLITAVYVGLLNVWGHTLPRDHPTTIKRRMLSVAAACTVSWVPVAWTLMQDPTRKVRVISRALQRHTTA